MLIVDVDAFDVDVNLDVLDVGYVCGCGLNKLFINRLHYLVQAPRVAGSRHIDRSGAEYCQGRQTNSRSWKPFRKVN